MAAIPADIILCREQKNPSPALQRTSAKSRVTTSIYPILAISDLFEYPNAAQAALYSITVTGEARPRLPVAFRGEADGVYSHAAAY